MLAISKEISMTDQQLYDAMGQRFAVIEVIGSLGKSYEVTAFANKLQNKTIADNLRYSEAKAIIKLLGENDGNS